MVKPKWFKRALAYLSLCLYSSDVVSDFSVGIDLVRRCHFKSAASVFSGLVVPGFLYGQMMFFHEADHSCKAFFKALSFSITIIPYTLWKLVKVALDIEDKGNMLQAKL